MSELSLARDISRTHDNTLTSTLSHHEMLYARTEVTYNSVRTGTRRW